MPIKVQGLTPLIEVFDMPASVAFYRDVIGFEVVTQSRPGDNFDWCLLRMGDAELMLNTAYEADERPASPDRARWAGHSHTTLFFFCPNLDEAYEHLRSKGIAVEKPAVRPYGMRQLSITDHDEYTLCFQYPVARAEGNL
jgi:catechol 2,3-dioxygenase-like lactoylglutathione lyase family enzyme